MGLNGLHQSKSHPEENGDEVKISSESDPCDRSSDGSGWGRVRRKEEKVSFERKRDASREREREIEGRLLTSEDQNFERVSVLGGL